MKKLLYKYKSIVLILAIICIAILSTCSTGNTIQTPKKIYNLQEYLPKVQGKTIAFQYDGKTDLDIFQYTYVDESRTDWREVYYVGDYLTDIREGYDYYDVHANEMSKVTTSSAASESIDYETYLIGEFDTEFTSSYGYPCKIVSDSGSVTTQTGTFDNCLVVDIQLDEETICSEYYAPELGFIYGETVSNGTTLYKECLISYTPSAYHSDNSASMPENDEYEDEGGSVEDGLNKAMRWYNYKTNFKNSDKHHTLKVDVGEWDLSFIMDGTFTAGTVEISEFFGFPDYMGYTMQDNNGEFTVKYYPDEEYIEIIDNVDDNTDYSGIYEYINK